jgi:hypothetical protein
MSELSPNEEDLLQRITEKSELRPLFFRKAKSLKWFAPLKSRGLFLPSENPAPSPADEEGLVSIPYWPALDYLLNIAPLLIDEANKGYALQVQEIMVEATRYAQKREYSNGYTWRKFSEILSFIPSKSVRSDVLEVMPFWLADRFESRFLAKEVGTNFLRKKLIERTDEAKEIAKKTITILFDAKPFSVPRDEVDRVDLQYFSEICDAVAGLAGMRLQNWAVDFFYSRLTRVLIDEKKDRWSSIWQPAIEEHEQNKYHDSKENLLLRSYRDCLLAFAQESPQEAREFVEKGLSDAHQTIQRVALFVITMMYPYFYSLVDRIIAGDFLDDNFRHEMWVFLHTHYEKFSQDQKRSLLEQISKIHERDEEGGSLEGATAYQKAIWLSAIKGFGEFERKLYFESTRLAQTEPDHPSFASFMTVGVTGEKELVDLESLQVLSGRELAAFLKGFNERGDFLNPGISSLSKSIKRLFKLTPLKFHKELSHFLDTDPAYIYEIIQAYQELWNENARLPWQEVWSLLISFCSAVVSNEEFWSERNAEVRPEFVANRYWLVGAIGRLIESGSKSDSREFDESCMQPATDLTLYLLGREKGEQFDEKSDAVSISINSARGHCLEALINLALQVCRHSDKRFGNHRKTWDDFQPYFEAELSRLEFNEPEYEFVTLFVNYLPNFIYLSKEWALGKLEKIFDQSRYVQWLCAMQGYAYVRYVYHEVFLFLRRHGDFLKALDDENLGRGVKEKVIENIVIASLQKDEQADDGMIAIILERNNVQELGYLIWFMWTLRSKNNDQALNAKVFELWPKILSIASISTKSGMKLRSALCHWAIFMERLDDENLRLLLEVAPYARVSHNSYFLLQALASLSKEYPFEAFRIWMAMHSKFSPDYPDESIRVLLQNLLSKGAEGERLAREAVSEYLKVGNATPAEWLKDLMGVEHG